MEIRECQTIEHAENILSHFYADDCRDRVGLRCVTGREDQRNRIFHLDLDGAHRATFDEHGATLVLL